MTSANPEFKRILSRNVALPLLLCAGLVAVLFGLLYYLAGVYANISRIDQALRLETETMKLVVDAETGVRGFLLTGKPLFLEPYLESEKRLPKAFQEMEEQSQEIFGRATLAHAVRDRYAHWDSLAKVVMRAGGNTGRSEAELLQRKAEMDTIRADFATYDASLEALRNSISEQSNAQSHAVAGFTALAALLIGAGIAFAGRRQLLALSASYETALAGQAAQNARLSDLAWIRTGLADLAGRLRSDLDEEAFGRNLLEYLAGYIGLDLGVVYMVRGEAKTLSRVAALGLSGEALRVAPSEIAFGQGLIGTAAALGKPLTRDVPAEYFRLESGSGATRPQHLVLVPSLKEGQVNGLVELAFLGAVSPRTREFLDGLAEVVGSAIRAFQFRFQLEEALRESQSLTEELQAQQEELRVSNEELAERTRVLQEAQSRLEGQHAELEQTNEQLEEAATELGEQKRALDERNRSLQCTRLELERKAEELTTASRYKTEFLANMSHELRTPLNSSLILAKLLVDNPGGNLNAEQVEFASTIYAAGNDLLQLINDILDLSKVEAGRIEIVPEDVTVASLLETMGRDFRLSAEHKGIEFRTWIDPAAPVSLRTDRMRLEQVLRNLIGNAVKFTSQGYVELAVAQAAQGGAVFRVRDTGIGIDRAQHGLIFEAFRQADGTTSRKYGGTGLGLSISSRLVDLLGGRIEVESEPGQGSLFTLTLPPLIEAPADAQAPVPAKRAPPVHTLPAHSPAAQSQPSAKGRDFIDDRETARTAGRRVILLVEDDARYLRMLFDFAHENGFDAICANHIAEAEELAQSWIPTAIVLDVRLPDGSGLSLLDRLKANPKTRHIPVHVLSAADYSREALNHGAAGFSLKPPHAQELKGFFGNILTKLERRTKRLLLVEDDLVQQKSVTRLLAEPGVEIVAVPTGEEALKNLAESSFDCVVMDLKLPDMSGLVLLDRATAGRAGNMPPVIVYTGKEIGNAEEEALLRHSRAIIIKGARSPERLLEEVTLFLHRPEAELSQEQRQMLRTSRNREKAFEGRTILVADDDVRNVFALTNALEQKGARALIARNGREAVAKVEADKAIDLVLMDVMMPEMDGLEAIRRIRAGHRKDVPIIAVTAKAMADDYERCLQAGANDYLAKPVDVERLVSLIRVWLPKRVGL